MSNFDMYSNYAYVIHRKTPKIILSFILLVTILSICFLVCFFCYSYSEQETYMGYVQKQDEFVVVIYVKDEEIAKLSSKKLWLEDTITDFTILQISEQYYLVDGDNYYQVMMKIPLEPKDKIENNILSLRFEGEKKTLWQHKKKGWFS